LAGEEEHWIKLADMSCAALAGAWKIFDMEDRGQSANLSFLKMSFWQFSSITVMQSAENGARDDRSVALDDSGNLVLT
jgi:hypothetical protein